MKRTANYRSRDCPEALEIVVMQSFFAVAAMPRQEDFGLVDAVATLPRRDDRLLCAKDSFSVRFKTRAAKVFFALLSLVVVWASASPALATMYITGDGYPNNTDPQQYARFYTGADKAFIGQPYDWSGVGSNGGPWATMISPTFFISATHYHPGTGSTVTFYASNSTSSPSYSGVVGGGSQIEASDVYLGWLTQPIPSSANIADYPVLTLPNDTAYVGTMIYNYGSPNLVGRNVISSIQTYTEAGEVMTGMFYNYDIPGVGPAETYLMGGDSGGPSFAVVNGHLALLGEHFSNWGTCGQAGAPGNVPPMTSNGALIDGDPNRHGDWWSVDGFVPHYVGSVNAQMAADAQANGVGSGDRVNEVAPSGGTWNVNGSGSWTNVDNWSSSMAPSSGTVTFAGAPSAAITVTLDGNQSAGALVFNVSGGCNGYTLSQGTGGALTLGLESEASITVVSGSHLIDAPVLLVDKLAVSGSGTLAFSKSSSISGTGPLTMNGLGGVLILSGSDSYSGGTIVTAGTLLVASNTALPDRSSLTVGASASLLFGAAMQSTPAANEAQTIPEPGTLALLGVAVCAAAVAQCARWRRK
jgi:autotransporter-associated beta strand protein